MRESFNDNLTAVRLLSLVVLSPVVVGPESYYILCVLSSIMNLSNALCCGSRWLVNETSIASGSLGICRRDERWLGPTRVRVVCMDEKSE